MAARSLMTAALVLPASPLALSSKRPSHGIATKMQRLNRQGKSHQAISLFSDWVNTVNATTPEAARAWVEAITAHGRLRKGEAALDTFQRMQAVFEPSLVAYTAAIRACATSKLWPVALSLLDDLRADGIRPDTIVCNAALVACERGGQLEEAELLLRAMEASGPVRSARVHYYCRTPFFSWLPPFSPTIYRASLIRRTPYEALARHKGTPAVSHLLQLSHPRDVISGAVAGSRRTLSHTTPSSRPRRVWATGTRRLRCSSGWSGIRTRTRAQLVVCCGAP